ncbi:hypothetical protein [Flavobacterium hibisci]|uniref:hypothetical protein n=1 Tax=Flavobacterium hibisci TaxID=1914462 RepID=UPI001CBCB725|nr:hypothetical protein [Flavobacterium hibisci]MBZ4041650.1 hypothetical protein [Flavobacterium hibisci]
MAINKTAKNLKVIIKNTHTSFSGTMHETAEKIVIVATKENLTLISGKKINIKGNKS